eukprot:COSAG02_NODE_29586_length_566_cov_1.325482_1_plen_151_part_01
MALGLSFDAVFFKPCHMRPATIFWGTGECGGGDGYSGVWAVASFALLDSSARVLLYAAQVILLWLAVRFAILPWALWYYGIVLSASFGIGVLLRAWRHSLAHLGRPSLSSTSCSLWPASGICPMALGLSFDAVFFKPCGTARGRPEFCLFT